MLAADESEQPRTITVSLLEFDVLAEYLGWESVPLVLKVPSPGRTWSERAALADSAWQALDARGLGRPSRLDPDLEWMLRLLARPTREVDGRLWLGRSVRVLAAADAERAVLAVKDGDSIALRPAASTGLPREAASVLPPLPAGPGKSVTLRSTDLDAAAADAGDDLERFRTELRYRGVRAGDVQILGHMISEAGARGQFGAAARDYDNRRVRASRVVGFFDSPHGRYAQLRRESVSGEAWSTIVPADTRRMIAHIDELLAEVTEGA